MDFEFETYTGEKQPRACIRAKGEIGFSIKINEQYGLAEKGDFATLCFDRAANVIGVRFTRDQRSPGTRRVYGTRYQRRDGTRNQYLTIHASGFLEFFGIDYAQNRYYATWWDDAHQMMLVDLNRPYKAYLPDSEAEGLATPALTLEDSPTHAA